MPEWDADSTELQRNFANVLASTRDAARGRVVPALELARGWQRETMRGLTLPEDAQAQYVGQYRGEAGLELIGVRIGDARGVDPVRVGAALKDFESLLQQVLAALDQALPVGTPLDGDGLAAVVEVAAWAHAEWIRIHPFANGNGRTARNWANFIFMRYGLPPAVRGRPRPGGGYEAASASAMAGDWHPTVLVFERMLRDAIAT